MCISGWPLKHTKANQQGNVSCGMSNILTAMLRLYLKPILTYLIKYAYANMHERFGEIDDLLSQIADSKRSQSQICFLNMHGKLRCIGQVQLWLTIIDERSWYFENNWELRTKSKSVFGFGWLYFREVMRDDTVYMFVNKPGWKFSFHM